MHRFASRRVVCRLLVAGVLVGLLAGVTVRCERTTPPPDPVEDAVGSITPEELHRITKRLASNAFEGRAPATRGERQTVPYLIEEFQRAGLQPGNGNSYVQDVRLVRADVSPLEALRFTGGRAPLRLRHERDVALTTRRQEARLVNLTASEVVFAGYGIVAPEYGWDDYADVDVSGKTVILLANDPGLATGDPSLFQGTTMTYYGHWTYKVAEAARQGAEAAFLIHDTRTAGRSWRAVRERWTGVRYDLVHDASTPAPVDLDGWIRHDAAEMLFERAGLNLHAMKARAASPGFAPISMGLGASTTVTNRVSRTFTRNVVAQLSGADRSDEVVLFTGHWDHLGRGTPVDGDAIYNGAVDNAVGVAGLVELAEAFAQLDTRPQRTVVFLATTAHEYGRLGARYYVEHPIHPLPRTAAVLNVDELNVHGPTRDVQVVGAGLTEMEAWLTDAAQAQDRRVRPAANPERGRYFRGDSFPFARRGVPTLWTLPGVDHVEHGADWMRQQRRAHRATRAHSPSDAYDATWNLSGAADDLRLLVRVGHRAATHPTFPAWTDASAYAARRDHRTSGR